MNFISSLSEGSDLIERYRMSKLALFQTLRCKPMEDRVFLNRCGPHRAAASKISAVYLQQSEKDFSTASEVMCLTV
jgi:hypothetical protein